MPPARGVDGTDASSRGASVDRVHVSAAVVVAQDRGAIRAASAMPMAPVWHAHAVAEAGAVQHERRRRRGRTLDLDLEQARLEPAEQRAGCGGRR
ncbi:MAG: hypothetical protein R2939_15780 [Kofleriaceae bacterium]